MAEATIRKKKISLVHLMRDGVSLLNAAEALFLKLFGFLALMYGLLRAFFHWK